MTSKGPVINFNFNFPIIIFVSIWTWLFCEKVCSNCNEKKIISEISKKKYIRKLKKKIAIIIKAIMKKKNFENSLRLTKIALLYSGIKISKTNFTQSVDNFFKSYLYYFNLVWLYMDVCGEINWLIEGILLGKSFIDLSLNAPCITISMLATSKSIFLYLNRNIVIKTIDKLRDIHPEIDDDDDVLRAKGITDELDINSDGFEGNREKTDVEKEILKESGKFLNFVVRLLYYICAVVVCAFPMMPVTSMAYDYYTMGKTECKYPYLVKYFFDAYKPTMWPAVYFHHVLSS